MVLALQKKVGDHPRVCGEQALYERACPRFQGSSPRVRGAEHSTMCLHSAHGIIPACAGSRRLKKVQ